MAIFVFILSFVLLVAGAACGYQALDLVPTGIGVLYAMAGAVSVVGAILTLAIGLLIRRVDALAKLVRQSATLPFIEAAASAEPPSQHEAPAIEPEAAGGAVHGAAASEAAVGPMADESLENAAIAEDESPININRSGHLPSLEQVETVLETPESPPSLIGSYSSAGANYKIFADGSIEAETSEGTFKFASMAEFKRHLVESKAKSTPEVE